MALQDYYRMRHIYGQGNPSPNLDPNTGDVVDDVGPLQFGRGQSGQGGSSGGDTNTTIPVGDPSQLQDVGQNIGPPSPPLEQPSQSPSGGQPDYFAPPTDLVAPNESGTTTQPALQTKDTDTLRQLIAQYPNREDFKPSILRRIGSAFIGVAEGTKSQANYLDSPYNQAVSDWANKVRPAENLANLERYGNTNMRQGIYQQGRNDLGWANYERQYTQGDERNRIRQEQININQEKMDHVVAREDLTEKEKLALLNKYRQEQIRLAGEMREENTRLTGHQQLVDIGARGEVEKDIQELRNKGMIEAAGVRGEEARKTKSTPSGNVVGKPRSDTQEKAMWQNLYGKAIREHPEWASSLHIDENGQVTIDKPTGWTDEGTKEYETRYNTIKQWFDDHANQTNAPSGAGTPNTPPAGTGTPPGAGAPNNKTTAPAGAGSPNKPAGMPAGKIRVKAPDGTTGTWDLAKGPIPKGFTEIR